MTLQRHTLKERTKTTFIAYDGNAVCGVRITKVVQVVVKNRRPLVFLLNDNLFFY